MTLDSFIWLWILLPVLCLLLVCLGVITALLMKRRGRHKSGKKAPPEIGLAERSGHSKSASRHTSRRASTKDLFVVNDRLNSSVAGAEMGSMGLNLTKLDGEPLPAVNPSANQYGNIGLMVSRPNIEYQYGGFLVEE